MKLSTKKRLLLINQKFYEDRALEFAMTRGQPWLGWDRLFKYLRNLPLNYSVLDYGCGHGRFLDFLKQRVDNFGYTGVDNSMALLRLARLKYIGENNINFKKASDIGKREKYDLITLFGVIHHIPGFEDRLALVSQLANRLKSKGYLVVTFWQLESQTNLYAKKASQATLDELELDSQDLEKNDYLLPFANQVNSWRYVHIFEISEIVKYIRHIQLDLVDDFVADGKSGKQNRYLVFRNV